MRKAPISTLRPMVGGIDIGSTEHWVCVPAGENGEEVEIRSFGTTTTELEALAAMLVERSVVSVAMESTSVYWIPLYELLEERGIEPVLVNARQLQNVPGRKTDIHDCQWIQTEWPLSYQSGYSLAEAIRTVTGRWSTGRRVPNAG